MIKVMGYTNRGIKSGDVSDLKFTKRFAWVDCLNPTQSEFKKLSEKTKIPVDVLKRSLDEDMRPRAIDVGDYSEFIFRANYASKKSKYEVVNFSVFTCSNRKNLVVLRNNNIKAFEKLTKLSDSQKKLLMEKGIGYLLYRILDEVLYEYFEVMDDLEDDIGEIESNIFRLDNKKTLTEIFNTKKSLIYLHKAFSANREAISNIQKEFITGIEKKHTRIFRDLYSDCTQLIDIVSTYRELLSSTMDIHLSAASNNLNEIVKVLSSFAAIIMVPTLITGIYGMNFKFMPELSWKYGYLVVIAVMIISASILYTIFRKKKWL